MLRKHKGAAEDCVLMEIGCHAGTHAPTLLKFIIFMIMLAIEIISN